MNNESNSIQQLVNAARARSEAASMVDAQHRTFLGRLGRIGDLVSQGTMNPAAADAQRNKLVADHRTFLKSVAEVPESQLQAVLNPASVPVIVPRERQAAGLIAQAEAAGVMLRADSTGRLEASPASRLTAGLRQALTLLRAEVVEALRADVWTVPA